MNSVMVDIETEGPDPGRHTMLQLAAVEFDEEWKITREFNQYLFPNPLFPGMAYSGMRGHSAETVEWWMRTAPHGYQKIKDECAKGFHAVAVMEMFYDWVPSDPLFWAWPTCFDIAFLQSYARDYCPALSKFLWKSADVKSWMSGCIATAGAPLAIDDRTRPPFEGVEHDALYDAKWQVWLMGKFDRDLDRWRKSVKTRTT